MNTILDPSSYADPVVSYSETEITIPAENIRAGDVLVEGGTRVASVKSGSKWTYLRDENEKVVAEIQNRDEVKVRRQEPTPEFSTEQYRARANRVLAERITARYGSLKAVQAKINEDLEKDGFVDYSVVSRLLQVQAESKILAEFAEVASRSGENGEDLVDVMREFADHLTHRLVREGRQSALMRDQSVVANLMVDVNREAMAEFVEKARWAF